MLIEKQLDNLRSLGKINTHVHYPLPRLQFICDILSARPAGPHIFVPVREVSSEIR
jgi:hypothetical protein